MTSKRIPQAQRKSGVVVCGGWERVEQRLGSIVPCQRSLHSAACWKDNIIVFGGYDGHQRLNDLYSYNLTSCKWSLLGGNNSRSPSPRDRHSAVIHESKFVVFGGFDGMARVDDMHFFDLEFNRWQQVDAFAGAPPSPRHSHSAVKWRESMFVFGGYDGSYRNDLHEFNFSTSTWSLVSCTGDLPRSRYRGTCVVFENIMILHGGHDGSRHLQDTLTFDFLTNVWSCLETRGPCPTPRDSHIAVVYERSMFLYGGSTGSAMGDFHELQLDTMTWTPVDTSNNLQMKKQHTRFLASRQKSSLLASESSAGGLSLTTEFSEFGGGGDLGWGEDPLRLDSSSPAQGGFDARSAALPPPPPPSPYSNLPGGSRMNQYNSTSDATSASTATTPANTAAIGAAAGVSGGGPGSVIGQVGAPSSAGATTLAGCRFCHVAAIYDDTLYVFGGYDGTHRLNDFVKFQFTCSDQLVPPSTLLADLKHMVGSELLSDVTFIIEGRPIHAHKVLCLRSHYFRNMLTGEFMESSSREVNIEGIRYSVFLQFLEYVYSDHVDITYETAMDLFQAADMFGADRLKKVCELVMLEALNVETASHILYAADERNAEYLREKCMTFVVNNFDAVSHTAGFEEMGRANMDLLFEILHRR